MVERVNNSAGLPEEERLDWRTKTTDFLGGPLAVQLKYAKVRPVERNSKLRRVEEDYWRQRGVEFTVVNEPEINRTDSDENAAGEHDHG